VFPELEMEVMLQTPKRFSVNVKKKKTLPLGQLQEETRRPTKVPHQLLETRSFAKVKSNNVVEAEPSELHFSGFEVGKDYKKVVRLINISSEVIHIHIFPTQTKYFQTEYTQKSRLVPGLALTLTVHFRPDEWRYFFDSVRIHCKGEETLQIPIHAYPVIDDLNIPPYINLFPVPLGKRSTCVIPLSCSCPVDFEFQVYCLKSHEAFTISPLSGIIPAKGKTNLSVTFTPQQYGTAEITLQLVISQFNSKPFICTLTASCSPNLIINQQREKEKNAETVKNTQTEGVVYLVDPKLKVKVTPPRMEKHTKKIKSDAYTQSSDVDISSHSGLAKMLIQHQDKMSYKDLRQAMSHTKTAYQTREMKEAAFEIQVQGNAQKDRANHLQWQVQLGDDFFSAEQKLKILKKQEVAASEYMMKNDIGGRDINIAQTTKLSSHRVVRCSGQCPDSTPVFNIYGSGQLEVRRRVLRLFQQIVRKVILQIRMDKRLRLLREKCSTAKLQVREGKNNDDMSCSCAHGQRTQILFLRKSRDALGDSEEKKKLHLLRLTSPIFPSPNPLEELASKMIGKVHVGLIEEDLTWTVPYFNLKVPQQFKLMGYQQVTVYDSKAFCTQNKQYRQLRTGAQNELLPMMMLPDLNTCKEEEPQEEERAEPDLNPVLCFKTPHNVLHPKNAHPLRIFNPAPGLCAFKPTPLYLESDPAFHLCPLTRHVICSDHVVEEHNNSTPKKFLDREDIIKGTMLWKEFSCLELNTVSFVPAQTSSQSPRMSDPFSDLLLPLEAPPSMKDLPENIREEISIGEAEGIGVSLNPDMVQAKFEAFEMSLTEDPVKDD
ncbi:cilia- and flagella-associated protein, partial [Clarias magur]